MRFPSRRGVYCVRQGRRHINGDGGNPMAAHSPTSPAARAKKPTVYETYLRTDELLALQKPAAERLHSDELTFQIVHQTFERWWKMTVEQFHVFRAAHLKLAERNLGLRAIGTGGPPMPALEKTLRDLLFPELWEVRDELLAQAHAGSADGADANVSGHGR